MFFSCTTFGHFENSFPKKTRGLILPHQLSEHIKKGVKSQDVAFYPHTVVFGLASCEIIAVIDCNICNTSCFLEDLLEKRCCLRAQVTRNPLFCRHLFFLLQQPKIVCHHQLLLGLFVSLSKKNTTSFPKNRKHPIPRVTRPGFP